jgi:hypothetical protein
MVRGETYIVRIYRRQGRTDRALKGVVEIVRQRRCVPFRGFDALRRILALPSSVVRNGTGEPPRG